MSEFWVGFIVGGITTPIIIIALFVFLLAAGPRIIRRD